MTMTNTTATTASAYKKLTSLSDHDKCNNFLMDIKNKFRGTNMTETVDGEKTIRGNLARLLTARVYPNAGGEMRTGTETISAPDNLGGDWGEDLAEQAEEIAWTFAYEMLGDELRARMSVRFDRDASTPTPPVEELHATFTEEERAVEELNFTVTEELISEYPSYLGALRRPTATNAT